MQNMTIKGSTVAYCLLQDFLRQWPMVLAHYPPAYEKVDDLLWRTMENAREAPVKPNALLKQVVEYVIVVYYSR